MYAYVHIYKKIMEKKILIQITGIRILFFNVPCSFWKLYDSPNIH